MSRRLTSEDRLPPTRSSDLTGRESPARRVGTCPFADILSSASATPPSTGGKGTPVYTAR